jgi:tetratricopeptide (TPR) repeat protein
MLFMWLFDSQGQRSTHCGWRCAWCWSALFAAVLVAFALPCLGYSKEPAEEFIRGLKERGLNELALDYLDRIQDSRLIDDKLRQQIPYHRGVVLLEQSRQSTDPAARGQLMDKARQELEQYVQKNANSVDAAEAQLQLGTMQLDAGQQLMAQAQKLPPESAYEEERRNLGQPARTHFAEAQDLFEQAAAVYTMELEKLPAALSSEEGSDANTRRQEYRGRVAQLRFLAAQTEFETAQTYPPGDDDFRTRNESAAKELAAVYEEFSRSTAALVGLYARLYEGRCYFALGEHQMALGCYEDIVSQPNVLPPFRKLIASAVHRRAEVLLGQEKYDEAIENCRVCLADAQPDEQKQPEWLAVRFRLAKALNKKAETHPSGSLDQRRLLAEARDAFRVVANSPGEFQTAARSAMTALADESAEAKEAPRTFQEAYDRGKDALASYNAARIALPSAEKNNPVGVPELEAQMQEGKEDARRLFGAAMSLIEDDTDLRLVNEVRYFLCWLYWEAEDYYRSAILGEFLARRYPDHPAASSAAKLSMASFERLYNKAAAAGGISEDTDFEARRMAQMAEFVARRWPGTDDADAAFSVLVSYAIRTNRIEEAERLLADASEQSRPRLELQLGNAMWARYLELSQSKDADRPGDTPLADLKQSAVRYLRSGFDAASAANDISDSLAAAGLYLVQAMLSDGQYQEAIALLENDEVGPLALVANGHSAASSPAYVLETYKAALRAYVLVTPPQERKALDAMKSLEVAVAKSGVSGRDAAEQLTKIYLGLGVALQRQVEELRAAGRGAEADRVAGAFAQFLDRIAARQGEANWATRVWLAQTYFDLGMAQQAGGTTGTGSANQNNSQGTVATNSNSGKPTVLKGKARDFVVKARDINQQLIDAAAKDSKLAPNETNVLAVRLRLGECLRALGQYEQALNAFSAILEEKESSLIVQRAAAYAYQERGQAEDAKWLERAIHGGYRLKSTGQNRIWGWLKISQIASRAARTDPKYRDTFYEARLNVARCRYLAAVKQSGTARQQDLAKAKQSIQSLAQLYPDMGGARWRGEFESLLKQIISAAGRSDS